MLLTSSTLNRYAFSFNSQPMWTSFKFVVDEDDILKSGVGSSLSQFEF